MKIHRTTADIRNACKIDENEEVCIVSTELTQGLDFMKNYEKSVTFFGSSKLSEDNSYYIKALNLGQRIAKDIGYAVATGGGPGIMEAGNRGAYNAGGDSLGITIDLPAEEMNKYVTDSVPFSFFFTRKEVLWVSAASYVFFPGGYGTMDELFGVLTLIKTDKIPKVPVILFGNEFWSKWLEFVKETLLKEYGTISESDLDIFVITEDEDKILEIIKNAPIRI